jgi:hypothetical protein
MVHGGIWYARPPRGRGAARNAPVRPRSVKARDGVHSVCDGDL